ncbi:hypothetical protein [Planomonospora sp. ID82291]|uniref:hypothetical protein n=1 Tax=Planomonospora sp. ID82291 TaxID=2738136 RepID=UPI0018C43FE8|nr:hypothetical protein [Planomonospora sp. ID82291]MBG0814768.1 hypothetical protein [Planomonospora sp. ID82291]
MRSRPGEVLIRVLAAAGVVAATVFAGPGVQAVGRTAGPQTADAGGGRTAADGGGRTGGAGVTGGGGRTADAGGVRTAGAGGAGAGGPTEPAGDGEADRVLFRFADERITESSGLAVSPTHEDVYYTHNDSEAGAVFFAVGGDGRTRAVFTLRGAGARDWEGMAVSKDPKTGRGVLWFADIGDNFDGAWPDVSVYKVAEPAALKDAVLPAVRYRFRYEDGGHNAEGVMVDPRSGRLHIVTKEFAGAVYAAPKRLRTGRVNVLRRVGSAPIMATDAAYAPDGSSFVVRTYISATVYRDFDEQLARVSMPPLEQAESIAYTADGRALLTGSEGADSPVHLVPLPDRVLEAVAPAPTPTPEGTARTEPAGPAGAVEDAGEDGEEDAGVPVSAVLLWLLVAVGATGVIVFIARRTG